MSNSQIIVGDCLEVMRTLDANSVDAVVTDPPYGLKFMGKRWDCDVPGVPVWAECLRVLKPGGHLLAFAGTRTQHRMCCSIEDAGFEIRDMLAWVYGSGFPKSLDVSKAIDKAAGAERERYERPAFGGTFSDDAGTTYGTAISNKPATEAAKQWQGWGTALKPSHEPVTWATKPLTVVPIDVIIQAESSIGGLICLSLSHASNVEKLLRSSPSECGGASVSALLIAAAHRGLLCAESSGVTAMFKSQETAKTILSIAESWNFILAAICERQSMFTTSTAISLTTALRTLNCLTSETIRELITPEGERRLGKYMSAPIAANHLNGGSANLALSTSVQGLVTWLTASSVASIVEQDFMPVARTGSIVLQSVITSLGESINPAFEPITLARKPLVGTVAANVLAFGTGAINVDGCRVEYASDADKRSALSGDAFKRKDTSDNGWSRPWMNDAERVDRMNREAKERAQSGRWPANLIHDGSDEVTDLLGNAARFFYCAKASKKDRDEGLEGDEREAAAMQGNLVAGQPLSGDGRPITTPRRKNHHPTVKPTDLMRYLCRLITPPNGLILDPFTGSGSTGKAAMLEGFRFVGIEREAEYAEIAKARIAFSNVSDNSCPLFDSPIQKDAA